MTFFWLNFDLWEVLRLVSKENAAKIRFFRISLIFYSNPTHFSPCSGVIGAIKAIILVQNRTSLYHFFLLLVRIIFYYHMISLLSCSFFDIIISVYYSTQHKGITFNDMILPGWIHKLSHQHGFSSACYRCAYFLPTSPCNYRWTQSSFWRRTQLFCPLRFETQRG